MNLLANGDLLEGSKKVVFSEILGNEMVKYYAFVEEKEIDGEIVGCYGIKVESRIDSSESSETIEDITTDICFIRELFELIVSGLVLPGTVYDITYDLIAS